MQLCEALFRCFYSIVGSCTRVVDDGDLWLVGKDEVGILESTSSTDGDGSFASNTQAFVRNLTRDLRIDGTVRQAIALAEVSVSLHFMVSPASDIEGMYTGDALSMDGLLSEAPGSWYPDLHAVRQVF